MNMRSKSAIACMVQDIKFGIASFEETIISKVNRSANKAADVLASLGHRVLSGCILLGRAPPCVVESLKQDCMQMNPVTL
jgi:hypothetical protein